LLEQRKEAKEAMLPKLATPLKPTSTDSSTLAKVVKVAKVAKRERARAESNFLPLCTHAMRSARRDATRNTTA
jgi:hypothetical protein